VLSSTDRRKVFFVIVIQVLFGILDLVGVALVGILGALAITGVQARTPGNRVSQVLSLLHLENNSLQSQAISIGLLAAAVLILKTVFSVIFLRKTMFFLARKSADISSNLISKVLAQPLISVQKRSLQETLYAITSGVDAISLGILNTSVLIISDSSLLLILGAGLFFVDPLIASSTFAVFAGIAFSLYKLMQVRAVKLGELQRSSLIESSEKTLEVLNSYREIVVRNRRSHYASELGKIRFKLADITAERSFMPNISKYVIEITVVIGSLSIAALQFALNDASHSIAVLAVFMAASTRISPAILRLQQGAISIKSNVGLAKPSLDLMDELRSLSLGSSQVDNLDLVHDGFTGEILLDDVTFSYPSKTQLAVDKVTISIQPGQVIAFVGPSGAGKTTIIDIILGILEPTSGKVAIQGMNPLAAISKWPGAIGYVPQDVMISNGTIRENVCLGYLKDEVKDKDVWSALEIAQLREFVENLPFGLDTPVGDRGTRLSGGQRQRLGIARAMFTQPKLLVLDEATSALDGSTEADISGAIQSLRGGVTILLIAHRLSTVQEADVVHYFEGGKLISSGTFKEVRSQNPEFDKQAILMGL
jgi:ABC-type multidrug transport system fused ATPase/permease subunit